MKATLLLFIVGSMSLLNSTYATMASQSTPSNMEDDLVETHDGGFEISLNRHEK